MSTGGRGARRRPVGGTAPRTDASSPASVSEGSRAPGVPVTAFAARAAVLGFVTAVVSSLVTGIVAGLVLAYGWGTPPTSVGEAVSSVGGIAAVGALAGAAWGAVVAMLAAWASMMLRSELVRGRRRARIVALALTVLLWLVGVAMMQRVLLDSDLILPLPGLLVALALVWWRMPWVLAAAGAPDR